MSDYKQNLENELWAMVAAIVASAIVGTGFMWAVVFMVRALVR